MRLGVEYIPSIANFLCVDVGRPAGEVYQSLLMEGVIARPLAGYELPRHLRITIGLEAENAQLIVALEKVLTGGQMPARRIASAGFGYARASNL